MESTWQTIQVFLTNFMEAAQSAVSSAESWQILMLIGALILIVLILAIGLKVANRSGETASEMLEEHSEKLREAETLAAKAQTEKEEALAKLENAKNVQIAENANQLALANARIAQLEKTSTDDVLFMNEARLEASRIVREAKDYAFTLASRADIEYAEMMRHANEEAESLRALSQQRLDQAHETLKKSLSRASEIIAEAHAEAARVNRGWNEAPPGQLIEENGGRGSDFVSNDAGTAEETEEK